MSFNYLTFYYSFESMLRINSKLLKNWLDQDDNSLGTLSDETGMSIHTLYLMSLGAYNHAPTRKTRKLLCRETGLKAEELFIPIEASEAS